jgi:hypothetical protein
MPTSAEMIANIRKVLHRRASEGRGVYIEGALQIAECLKSVDARIAALEAAAESTMPPQEQANSFPSEDVNQTVLIGRRYIAQTAQELRGLLDKLDGIVCRAVLSDREYEALGRAWGKVHGKTPWRISSGWVGWSTNNNHHVGESCRVPDDVFNVLTETGFTNESAAYIAIGRAVHKLGWASPAEQVVPATEQQLHRIVSALEAMAAKWEYEAEECWSSSKEAESKRVFIAAAQLEMECAVRRKCAAELRTVLVQRGQVR